MSAKWDEFIEGVPLVETAPLGYFTIVQYAKRLETSDQRVRKGLDLGKIPLEACIKTTYKNNKKRYKLYINWDTTVYGFIMTMAPEHRPSNFIENREQEYKPVQAPTQPLTLAVPYKDRYAQFLATGITKPAEESNETKGIRLPDIFDIGEANVHLKRLDIAKKEAELKLANNDLISMAAAQARFKEIGYLVKAALRQMEGSAAHELVGKTDVVEIKKILADYHELAIKQALCGGGTFTDAI